MIFEQELNITAFVNEEGIIEGFILPQWENTGRGFYYVTAYRAVDGGFRWFSQSVDPARVYSEARNHFNQ